MTLADFAEAHPRLVIAGSHLEPTDVAWEAFERARAADAGPEPEAAAGGRQ